MKRLLHLVVKRYAKNTSYELLLGIYDNVSTRSLFFFFFFGVDGERQQPWQCTRVKTCSDGSWHWQLVHFYYTSTQVTASTELRAQKNTFFMFQLKM
jgi:hypothetical protein